MHGATGMSQVLSALLHGVCALYTNDQQTVGVRVKGNFSISRKLVSESTAAFLAAMEPQPLWTGSLPVCLVEYHQGHSRRLRLVLTSQSLLTKGEKSLLDEQRPVHSRVHSSGLLFGYAADRCTDPDWLVLPDGSQPNAWRLLHAARKGGDRFCVGSCRRYAPGQADDAANKAKEYQFESLHKIYFYDAWRWKIELNQPESSLHLPPRPGLLQNGCYWCQHTYPANATESHNTQDGVALQQAAKMTCAFRTHGISTRAKKASLPAGEGSHPACSHIGWCLAKCANLGRLPAAVAGKALCGETVFARVFGPQTGVQKNPLFPSLEEAKSLETQCDLRSGEKAFGVFDVLDRKQSSFQINGQLLVLAV